MQARFYAGARGTGPQFVAGPQIFEGFPVFFITDIVFVMT